MLHAKTVMFRELAHKQCSFPHEITRVKEEEMSAVGDFLPIRQCKMLLHTIFRIRIMNSKSIETTDGRKCNYFPPNYMDGNCSIPTFT